MINTMGLVLFGAVIMAMVQPFDSRVPIDLAVLEEETFAAANSQKQIKITSTQQSAKSTEQLADLRA